MVDKSIFSPRHYLVNYAVYENSRGKQKWRVLHNCDPSKLSLAKYKKDQ